MKEPQVYLEEGIEGLVESIDNQMGEQNSSLLNRAMDVLESIKSAPALLEGKSAEEIAIYFNNALTK